MTPAETSKAMALAIGYLPEHVRISNDGCIVNRPSPDKGDYWSRFDFAEPDVIWPIAERYDCFPYRMASNGKWWAHGCETWADTAAEAVARAVIGKSKA